MKGFWRQFFANVKRGGWKALGKSLLESLIFVVFGLIIAFGYRYARPAYIGSVNIIGEQPTQSIIALFAIFCGWAAWVFKHSNLIYYGIGETVFGSASAFAIAFNMGPTTTLAQLASLIGCAYVIARGLGNIAEGQAEEEVALAGL